MLTRTIALLLAPLVAATAIPAPALAQDGPLRITISEGVIEPLPFAVPGFQAETAGAEQIAADITRVVAQDLTGTGLFREIPAAIMSQIARRFQ